MLKNFFEKLNSCLVHSQSIENHLIQIVRFSSSSSSQTSTSTSTTHTHHPSHRHNNHIYYHLQNSSNTHQSKQIHKPHTYHHPYHYHSNHTYKQHHSAQYLIKRPRLRSQQHPTMSKTLTTPDVTSNNSISASNCWTSKVNYFGNSFLDRQSDRRKDSKWLDEQMRSPKSVFILFHVDRPFMSINREKNEFGLSKFTYEQVKPFLEKQKQGEQGAATNWLFLGIEYERNENATNTTTEPLDKGQIWSIRSPYSNIDNYYNRDEYRSWFAIDTSGFDEDTEKIGKIVGESGKFYEGNFLRMMAIHDVFESSVIAQARSVFCWLDRNKFCATCGNPNHVSDGGYKLACSNTTACKSHSRAANKHIPSNIHYPRVDPVAIMLVISPDRSQVLLGRKKAFPGRMFSCLAGYVEAGESFEEAVRRETFEECGIHCDRVEYHSSQPWPFPSTLMLGCMAYARSTDIKVDGNELDEARWFSREEIELICRGQHPQGISIPPDRAIANRLINYWSQMGGSNDANLSGSKL